MMNNNNNRMEPCNNHRNRTIPIISSQQSSSSLIVNSSLSLLHSTSSNSITEDEHCQKRDEQTNKRSSRPTIMDLPQNVLDLISSQSCLDCMDRLRLQLSAKLWKKAVDRTWNRIDRLRVANTESDDDRLSSAFVLSLIGKCPSLVSVTLCLNSSVNAKLCDNIELFEKLTHCVHLRELTLLLTQLPLFRLNAGLEKLSGLALRKLALVNSVADRSTARVIVKCHSGISSLGLINCWYMDESIVSFLVDNLSHLQTLNIRASRLVTREPVQKLIHRCELHSTRLKLYIQRSGTQLSELKYRPNLVSISGNASRKRNHRGCCSLADDAVRPDWEYDSEEDF